MKATRTQRTPVKISSPGRHHHLSCLPLNGQAGSSPQLYSSHKVQLYENQRIFPVIIRILFHATLNILKEKKKKIIIILYFHFFSFFHFHKIINFILLLIHHIIYYSIPSLFIPFLSFNLSKSHFHPCL